MIGLVVAGSLFAVLAGGCAVLISQLNNLNINVDVPTRKHLGPIAVSPAVCPYVRVMHAAANTFQSVNPLAGLVGGAATANVTWPTERARLEQSLNVLGFAVAASRPKFPGRIQQRLGVVLTSIRSGKERLALAQGSDDITAAGDLFRRGEYAFGDVSDLIGGVCGVHLAANT